MDTEVHECILTNAMSNVGYEGRRGVWIEIMVMESDGKVRAQILRKIVTRKITDQTSYSQHT